MTTPTTRAPGITIPVDPRSFAYRDSDRYGCLTIREEWRRAKISDEAEIEAAFGPDWKRYKPFATHVVYTRTVRSGMTAAGETVKDDKGQWRPFVLGDGSHYTVADAMPDDAIPLSGQAVKVQLDRAAVRAESARLREREQEREQKARAKEAREQAYARFARSESGHPWHLRWNTCIARLRGTALADRLRDDETGMALYRAATTDGTTIPEIRRVVKAAVEYLEEHYTFELADSELIDDCNREEGEERA